VSEDFYHEPVLLNEAINLLLGNKDSCRSKIYVDCTLGGGGYAKKILEETGKDFRLIAIDRDENAIGYSIKSLSQYTDRIIFIKDNFSNIKDIVKRSLKSETVPEVSGIALDLGLSTYQLDYEEGFSYQKNTPLNMRAGGDAELTAADVLNDSDEKDLVKIFKEYGELRYTRQITRDIIEYRKQKNFETTGELVEVLKKKIPKRFLNKDLSKVFQALRIAVNDELENLKKVLEGSQDVLEPGARIAAVSYHSLEDRIVKNFFRSSNSLRVLTKKPITASEKEIRSNIRARSAKLRAAEKVL
jgi:16S rRNA (cytosine1402-N4)-methyltransferase